MNNIRFFDSNVYIGRSAVPRHSIVSTPAELCAHMERIRLERALVFHKEALNDPVFGNELLLSQIKDFPSLTGCAVLAPHASGEFGNIREYFRTLFKHGIKAIRLFPNVHSYTLKPYVIGGVLDEAAAFGMPVIIDCVSRDGIGTVDSTWDFFPDCDGIYELAKLWNNVNFIVAIPGMTSQRQQYAILDACPNVHLETGAYSYRFIENVCRLFSADRLIFGSYMPVVDPAAGMTGILYANISDEEKAKIAGGNLERLISKVGAGGQILSGGAV